MWKTPAVEDPNPSTELPAPPEPPTPVDLGWPGAPPPPAPPGGFDPPSGRPRRGPGRTKRAVAGATAALVLMAGGYGIRAATASGPSSTTTAPRSATTTTTVSVQQTGDVSGLVSRAERSVVRVTSQVVRPATFFSPAQTGEAVGTGFVVASDGLILTNYHVVEGARSIAVTLGRHRYAARVVASDPTGDLAVLRIDATRLTALPVGDSSHLRAGQSVVAIGYALGLQGSPTVTTGIVSSTGRTIQVQDDGAPQGPIVRTYRGVVQISAAINAGNSGGPLLNLQGQVIGIDTAGAQNAQNIGFAIPIDHALSLLSSVE